MGLLKLAEKETTMNTINGALIKDFRSLFNKMSVGRTFDEYWIPDHRTSNYPPYNLVQESENNYRIEIAVAGFSKEMLKILEEEGRLTVEGKQESSEHSEEEELWQYNGLAQRKFTRSFYLAPNVEVSEAKLENGILVIRCHKDVDKNQKMIEIL